MTTIQIRDAVPADAPALAPMCAQLGYPIEVESLTRHLQRIQRDAEGQVFVAEREGRALGWLHIQTRHTLHAAPYADVTGLVVEETEHGKQIGAALLACAEHWALQAGFAEIHLRSNLTRERAHRFYERAGYVRYKTSVNFRKVLGPPTRA
jgi:GNAT superfamily N-acetyltransferase